MATALNQVPEKVFHSGDEFFDGLLSDIASAKRTIDFEAYIFESDALGRRVADALMQAAAKGVRVRVLVDGVGSPNFHADFLPELLSAGIDCRVYHPFPWKLLWTPVARIPSIKTFFTLLGSLNRRNHRKAYLIDGQIGWVGSINISACHVKRLSGRRAWRDTGMRIVGDRVAQLEEAFEAAWAEGWYFRRRRGWLKGGLKQWWSNRRQSPYPLVRLNDTRFRRERFYRELVRKIARAETRVWITSAYFVPRAGLIYAFCHAARNGADVRILLPSECDVFFIPWVSSAFYGQLLKAGVKIYEYKETMCHAKVVLIDDWATVGSTNLNHRSMNYDLEVDVVVTTPQARQSLSDQFLIDLSNAREIKIEEWNKRPWLERMACRTLLLIKHWV